MNNAELIKALRECEYCNVCSIAVDGDCPFGGRDALEAAAADALEAAEQQIAELKPKEGEWIDLFGHDYKCSVCGEWYRMDGTPEQEDMNYCPNCGAKMRTVTDCHTLEERER